MLKRLIISNYAIIDALEIEFSPGLNIITGETGAGKSILMGALSLILGDRADTSVLLNRKRKCVVEGYFEAGTRKEVSAFLRQYDLDEVGEGLFLRREIAASGKSRAFVNDTPVTLDQMKALSSWLVDLHRQFDARDLGSSSFQREVVDALAGHKEELQQYHIVFQQLKHSRKELLELLEQKDSFNREFDYNKFLFDELDEAALKENELEEGEAELKRMNNVESVKSALTAIVYQLDESDSPVVQQLKIMVNQLQPYVPDHPGLPDLLGRLQAAQVEVQDIAEELQRINQHIQYDAARIQQLDERLSLGYRLLKKHGVRNTGELLAIRDRLDNKLQAILNIDGAIDSKEKVVKQLEGEAGTLADRIRSARLKVLPGLQDTVNKLLHQVGMPNARFRAGLEPLNQLEEHGADHIEFLFDANRSERFEPIRKVASGGELSRLMLCIKSLVAESVDLPTLIFDEIDTGISGEAARQVGIIMKKLAKKRQVISITHQPQIAGRADAHYFVYKEPQSGIIRTRIRTLSLDERISTIARMLGGEKPSPAAMENAREMVMN